MSGCTSNETAGAGVSPEQVAEGRARKERSDCKVTDVQIYAAIVQHMGVLTYAARALGILRPTLYRRIERALQLQACLDAARAVLIEIAWERFGEALDAKARWAIIFGFSRLHGVPITPRSWPSESYSVETSAAPAERKKSTPLVPRPDEADASTLRLVLALENGEPWAIKYCLSHLDPDGLCGVNQVRGKRSDDYEAEKSVAEDEEEEIDPEVDAHGDELASGYAQQRHAFLTGRIRTQPAPPVVGAEASPCCPVGESLRDSNFAAQPDTAEFRWMAEPEAQPRAAPPLAEASRSASTGVSGAGFEPRSDSATLRHAATQERPDEIVTRPSRDLAAKKTKLRRRYGNAGGAEQAAPPVPDDDLDDKETDELFRQIREMALAFQAAAAPPVAGIAPVKKPDINEFKRLLERGRARLPSAPPVR